MKAEFKNLIEGLPLEKSLRLHKIFEKYPEMVEYFEKHIAQKMLLLGAPSQIALHNFLVAESTHLVKVIGM